MKINNQAKAKQLYEMLSEPPYILRSNLDNLVEKDAQEIINLAFDLLINERDVSSYKLITLANFAQSRSIQFNVEKVENAMLSINYNSQNPQNLINFAGMVKGANVKKFEDFVAKSGNALLIADFVKVIGVDRNRLINIVCELNNPQAMMHCTNLANGEMLKKLKFAIFKTNDSYWMWRYLKDIEKYDLRQLEDFVCTVNDFQFVWQHLYKGVVCDREKVENRLVELLNAEPTEDRYYSVYSYIRRNNRKGKNHFDEVFEGCPYQNLVKKYNSLKTYPSDINISQNNNVVLGD